MDFSTALLFAVAALLGINHVVFRIPGWERRRILFWLVQLLNLSTAVYVLIWGLPGFEETAAVAVKWVLGLLLVLHIVTNNQRLVRALQDASGGPEVDARRSRIKAALARGEEYRSPTTMLGKRALEMGNSGTVVREAEVLFSEVHPGATAEE